MIVVGLVKYLSEVCHVLIEPGEYPYFVGIHLFFFIPENVSGCYHDLLTDHKSGRDGVIHSRVGFPAAEDERVLAIRQIPHIRDTVPGASGSCQATPLRFIRQSRSWIHPISSSRDPSARNSILRLRNRTLRPN